MGSRAGARVSDGVQARWRYDVAHDWKKRNGAMKVTLTLRDDLATAVLDRPDPDEFVERAVSAAVAAEAETRQPAVALPSKWADLVKRIEAEVPSLGDYEPVLRRHQLEFRRGFRFKHDLPE